MRRSLAELISDDLNELAYFGSDVVASEEAIRFLMRVYKDKNALGCIDLVHKDNFVQTLKTIILSDENKLAKQLNLSTFNQKPLSYKQYQFLVEVGSRSMSKQRQPETVHYCAVDFFLIQNGQSIAFVADHYRGHDGFYSAFQEAANELGVHFIIAGNSTYQADSVHCPIFSLYHLSLTYRDSKFIYNFLVKITKNNNQSTHTLIDWNLLPPDYLLLSQSVSMLWRYVDTVKAREQTADVLPSKLLTQAFFDQRVSVGLYPDYRDQGKVRNRNIKLLANRMAGEAVVLLEHNKSIYSEIELANICYKTRYPLVYELLIKALKIADKYPFILNQSLKNYSEFHPIGELIFYYAGVIENCLQNEKFKSILNNQAILIAMHFGWLDLKQFFTVLTDTSKECQIKQEPCNIIFNNLAGFTKIIERSLLDDSGTGTNLLPLLLTAKTKDFFKEETLGDLFNKGLIPLKGVELIHPHQIDKNYYNQLKEDLERLDYLRKTFLTELSNFAEYISEHDSEDQDELDFSLFDIPEPIPFSNEPSLEKPELNMGLLAQSMSKSVFNNVKPNQLLSEQEQGLLQSIN
ncbi:hypothetical protein ACNVED_05900 [Legionella sp. D16C41]|uniref:hypothetical protein n=1 Tax=Legionella sp. D16C41 TaxID=3402688 RepID=UPI003AF76A71